MINNTCGFERISFTDDFSRYNQIKMYPEDKKHAIFWTPLGVFCYKVMSFGLKNAGATYQHAMSTIFCDHLRITMEYYVDDIVTKSHDKNNHLHDFRTMFDLMRAHQLKMNLQSLSWEFQVASSLDSLSHPKEFILIPTRSKPFKIWNLERISRTQRSLWQLAYIRRFIVNLSGRCQPFIRLMKKGVSFVWNDACQKAFEDIKAYCLDTYIA